jgi:Tol biopolymer transport system component
VRERGKSENLFRVHIDGSQEQQLTNTVEWNKYLLVTPENWLLFQSNRDGNAEIYRMRLDGSQVQRLTDAEGIDSQPMIVPLLPIVAYHEIWLGVGIWLIVAAIGWGWRQK